MSYPFVKAFYDYGARKGPVLAFLVHMAEGGGTVGFLSRQNPNGVSVHYVIERTGRTVQMLQEGRASGSVNPKDIRTTDDPDGLFGATAAKAVLGTWWKDPNSAVISLELEGFAKDGPNPAQRASLIALVADARSRYPRIGLLGHRDFADYKACPGKLIPWAQLGGHGPAKEDDAVEAPSVFEAPYQVRVKLGTWLYWYSDFRTDDRNVQLTNRTPDQLVLDYSFTYQSGKVAALRYESVTPDDNVSSRAMFCHWEDFDGPIFAKPEPPAVDCTPVVAKAVEDFRIASMDAIRKVPVPA